jgi:hypothetical protein
MRLARSGWARLPLAVRAALLMVTGCLLFSIMGALAIAPIDYSRLIFAGIMGFLLFAELPDRYTLVGAAIIVGSTLYIAYRETHLSRLHRAALAARLAAQHPEEANAPEPMPRSSAAPEPVADGRVAPLSGIRSSARITRGG